MTDTLALCLGKHGDEPSLVEVVFGCMRVCASKSTTMQTQLCTEDTVELIIKAMCSHTEGEETVQEQGCLVISELAKSSDVNIALLKRLQIEKALDQAAGLITNERNKKYPGEAKTALGM
jgi:hypothetical protein